MSHIRNRVEMATRLADFIHQANNADRHHRPRAAPRTTTVGRALLNWRGRNAPRHRRPRACVLIALLERRRPLDAGLLEGLPS